MKKIVIDAKPIGLVETFVELWHSREVLSKIIKKEIRIQYKQTILGVMWVLFRPLATVAIFATIFRYVIRFPAGETPYAVFVMCGIVPWMYFAEAVRKGSNSLQDNAVIMTRIYFTRIILPISAITASLLDLIIGIIALLGVMLLYGLEPKAQILLLPLFLLLMYLFTFGVSLCLSPPQALFRDVNIIFTFTLTAWMYLTPIIYPLNILPQKLQNILVFNPMTGIVQAIRWCVIGNTSLNWHSLLVAVAVTTILLTIGLITFRNLETTVIDQV